jgi:predicted ATP-grasp superfamily ATP-dependent carboligase
VRDAIVILAQSGRALAQAARRAGLRPYVADLFGDEDTRGVAKSYRPLKGALGGRLSRTSALQAACELAHLSGHRLLGVLLGSGFEGTPALVAELASEHRLLGADAAVLARLKDPLRFEMLLAELGIPHPPVSLSPVPRPEEWLSKRVGGSGGGHIGPAHRWAPHKGQYLQKRVAGRPVSVAFLANGLNCEILAYTEQWTAPSRSAPFRYGGAALPAAVEMALAVEMAAAIRAIVRETGLRGLASADCLVDENRWWLLEVNPRPGATLDILDRCPTALLSRHIAACAGHLGSREAAPPGAAAIEIVYAKRTIPAAPSLDWPDYVADRPRAGSRIAAGAPICTVMAEGPNAGLARQVLQQRSAGVRGALERKGHEDEWGRFAPKRECSGRTAC